MNHPGDRRAITEQRRRPSLATIMAKTLSVPQSGKLGITINVRSRYGQVQRQYVVPKDPKTPAQGRVRANLGRLAATWRRLTQEQRNAWLLTAPDVKIRNRLGRAYPLTGFQLYLKINCARAALGLDPLIVPLPIPVFPINPVSELKITNGSAGVSLQLSVSGAPAQYTVVCGAAPCSAGRSSAQHFSILGFLPGPVKGLSNITDLYVARYGPIPPGSRIFIRTYQHIDGWEDLPRQATAIVPAA